MLDGKQLRVLFQQFNAQYFCGRLPPYAIRAVTRIPSRIHLDPCGRIRRKRRLIEIARGPDDEVTSTLLHEMAHAATTSGHGMTWKREMIRLREEGAPLVSPDLDVDTADWDGSRVSRTHFRRVIEDMLQDIPGITLSAAVRGFIREEGGPPTISGFLKKYPWVPKVFLAEKRSLSEDLRRTSDLLLKLRANKTST